MLSTHLLSEVLEIQDISESKLKVQDSLVSTVEFTLPKIDFRIRCLIPDQFPAFSPRIITIPSQGSEFELPLAWNSESEELPEHQLGQLIKDALFQEITALQTVSAQEAISYGPPGSAIAATTDRKLAKQQGWQPLYSQNRTQVDIRDEYFARSGGILSKRLREKCVAIFGCGSGGSYLAEQLVRSGLGEVILCDMDKVETHNLCRSGYEIADIGVPKVLALARKLRNINPDVKLTPIDQDLTKLAKGDHEQLKALIESSQVVLAGTDMPKAQKILNKYAYSLGIPAVFPGLYDGAAGGEIILTIPDKTPCYACSNNFSWSLRDFYLKKYGMSTNSEKEIVDKVEEFEEETPLDYTTGTLKAEPGLAGDIHHLDSITLKLILGLLLQDVPDQEPCQTRDFVRGLTILNNDGNLTTKNIVFTCHQSNFWFFHDIRNNREQDYAYHTVWVEISDFREKECSVCGDSPEPLKPMISLSDIIQEKV